LANRWKGGSNLVDEDQRRKELKLWGWTDEQIEAQLAQDRDKPEQDSPGIWPEHQEVVRVFVAMRTQWRLTWNFEGRRFFEGLDYSALDAVYQGTGIKPTPELFSQLQLMEITAMNILNT